MLPSVFPSKAGIWLIVLAAAGSLAAAAETSLISRVEELALRVWTPRAELEIAEVDLDETVSLQIEDLAGTRPTQARLVQVVARDETGQVLGYSYTESHIVRTKPEILLISLTPDAQVLRIDVLFFAEPPEYLPSERWLAQFNGEVFGPKLRLKRNIRTVAGATLSSRAATDAVRRVLVLHQLLAQEPGR